MRLTGVVSVAGAVLVAAGVATVSAVHARESQSAATTVYVPSEAVGLNAIARALIAAYDHADVLALGEWHGRISLDADLRLALVRHPDFAKRVRFIVIECASVTEQPTLDRYIRGEDVPRAQLERVWKATSETTNGFCDAPAYPDFLSAVRNVNSRLPVEARIRVLGGHPGPGASQGIETTVASVLKEQVFGKHGKALLVFGAAHFYRNLPSLMLASMGDGIGLVRRLEADYPRRTFVVIPVGPLDPPRGVTEDIVPDFQKFDRALRTPSRPVLVSLQELPFRDFKAEEFIGRTVTHCDRARGCESAFSSSPLTLGQIADACVYIGGALGVRTQDDSTRVVNPSTEADHAQIFTCRACGETLIIDRRTDRPVIAKKPAK
jgi:hypothetical protein